MFLNLSRPVSESICWIVLEQYTVSRLAAGCFSVAHVDLTVDRVGQRDNFPTGINTEGVLLFKGFPIYLNVNIYRVDGYV